MPNRLEEDCPPKHCDRQGLAQHKTILRNGKPIPGVPKRMQESATQLRTREIRRLPVSTTYLVRLAGGSELPTTNAVQLCYPLNYAIIGFPTLLGLPLGSMDPRHTCKTKRAENLMHERLVSDEHTRVRQPRADRKTSTKRDGVPM